MAYDFAYMVDRVQKRLGDDGDDEDILDYIKISLNDAERELCNSHKYRFMESTATLSLAQNAQVVTGTPVYQQILQMFITSPVDRNLSRKYMDYDEFMDKYANVDAATVPAQPPTYWTTFAGAIQFPFRSDQAYTIRLNYIAIPGSMVNDADVPVIPEEFQELLVLGAIMRLMDREDDFQLSSQEMQKYTKMETQMVLRYGRGTEIVGGKRIPASWRR